MASKSAHKKILVNVARIFLKRFIKRYTNPLNRLGLKYGLALHNAGH